MAKLADEYDSALEGLFRAGGYGRSQRGSYVQSVDGLVWRGLSVSFYVKKKVLTVQPNVQVFCPSASKLAREGLEQIYRDVARSRARKLGWPLVTHPLYDCVRRQYGEDRMPWSYDIESVVEIDPAVHLIYDDFLKVANKFFGYISSLQYLRDHIVAHPSGTAAGIYAMVLTYLLDKKVTDEQIDGFCRLSPNPMTKKFAEQFKAKIAVA